MKRGVLNFLTVSCLLLCVAAAGLWAWSYFRVDVVKWRGDKAAGSAFAFRGGLHAGWTRWVNPGGRRAGFRYSHMPVADLSPDFDPVAQCPWHRRLAGFGFGFDRTPASDLRVQLRLPLAFLAVAGAAAPAVAWRRRAWRANRAARGQCARCGYDLRAMPGRCPECGADRTAAAG